MLHNFRKSHIIHILYDKLKLNPETWNLKLLLPQLADFIETVNVENADFTSVNGNYFFT